jgi:exonuclease III
MKIATWNVNSLTVRLPQVLDWLATQKAEGGVDVLALQELKLTDDKFPLPHSPKRVTRRSGLARKPTTAWP